MKNSHPIQIPPSDQVSNGGRCDSSTAWGKSIVAEAANWDDSMTLDLTYLACWLWRPAIIQSFTSWGILAMHLDATWPGRPQRWQWPSLKGSHQWKPPTSGPGSEEGPDLEPERWPIWWVAKAKVEEPSPGSDLTTKGRKQNPKEWTWQWQEMALFQQYKGKCE